MGVHFTRQAVCRAAAAAAWHRLPRLAYPAAACFMRPASLLSPCALSPLWPPHRLPSRFVRPRLDPRLAISPHTPTVGLSFLRAAFSGIRFFLFLLCSKRLIPCFPIKPANLPPVDTQHHALQARCFFAGLSLMHRGDRDRKAKPPAYTPAAGTNTKTPGQMPGGQSHNRLIGRRFFCYTSSIMAISAASPRRTPVLMMRV